MRSKLPVADMTSSVQEPKLSTSLEAAGVRNRVRVAWISFFPIEWLADVPERLRNLPKQHPATWQRVLLAELEQNPGIQLHIIILRKHFEKSETIERNGVLFHLVKTAGGLRAPSLFWLDTLLIRRVLGKIQPDVVHAWGTEHGAALVAARLGYPYVVTMQGLLKLLAGIVPLDYYPRFAALLEGWSMRRAATVTAESSFAIQYLRERYPHLDLHQIEHAPLPVFGRLERRPSQPLIRFLFVGTFSHLKGVDVMLQALDALKDEISFELILVGPVDEAFFHRIRSQSSAALWKRVHTKGTLSPDQIAEELSVATMMIYPTRCDNSPNAVKEAVVAGVPVVASAVGGIVDYVFPGRNGCLFQAGEVLDCARAIEEAVAHPMFCRGLVEATALNEVRSYLSAERMGGRFLDLYRSIAEGARDHMAT
jgi:glycosyltransferase involved in cell wall biosynthesis